MMKNYSTNGCGIKLNYCQYGSKPPFEKVKVAVDAGRYWLTYPEVAKNATKNSIIWAGKPEELGISIPGASKNQLVFIQL
ncbi:MAG: hypothetical protein IKG42_00460 [Clostridia bacterium]|nr:hypothetical protein [Clostridia bacterium]